MKLVTLVNVSYLPGLFALLESLIENGRIKPGSPFFIVYLEPGVLEYRSQIEVFEFKFHFINVQDLGFVAAPLKPSGRDNFEIALQKLLIFRIQDKGPLCFIDADMLCLNSIREAGQMDHFSVAPNPRRKGFNSGFMVFRPSISLFNEITKYIQESNRLFRHGDQGVLNNFLEERYPDTIKLIDVLWNVDKKSYLENKADFPDNQIKLFHYISHKPWWSSPTWYWVDWRRLRLKKKARVNWWWWQYYWRAQVFIHTRLFLKKLVPAGFFAGARRLAQKARDVLKTEGPTAALKKTGGYLAFSCAEAWNGGYRGLLDGAIASPTEKSHAHLRRLIEGQRVLIIGSGPSANELERIPDDVKVFTCNRGVQIFRRLRLDRRLDLYMSTASKMKRLEGLEGDLARVGTKILVVDDFRYVRKHHSLGGVFSDLVYDNGKHDFYIKKLIHPHSLSSIRGSSHHAWTSTGIRLLQYALYFGASEIYLTGIDFGKNGYFWGKNEDKWLHDSIDENFVRIVAARRPHVYSLTRSNSLASILPHKTWAGQTA